MDEYALRNGKREPSQRCTPRFFAGTNNRRPPALPLAQFAVLAGRPCPIHQVFASGMELGACRREGGPDARRLANCAAGVVAGRDPGWSRTCSYRTSL